MNRLKLFVSIGVMSLSVALMLSACNTGAKNENGADVEIATEFGVIQIKLYDETPLHKENFLKLAREGYYDGTLFHRVIEGFMIQGGDPKSRGAAPDQPLGDGGPDYKIPAEFNANLFHKKGALAAARESDGVNPEKASSGSQFYLVHGRSYTMENLMNVEVQQNNNRKNMIFGEIINLPENAEKRALYTELTATRNSEGLQAFYAEMTPLIEERFALMQAFVFSEEQRQKYTTIGGAPSLDGEYTVFGEVVSGLEIIDKIATLPTQPGDRPEMDVVMKVRVLGE